MFADSVQPVDFLFFIGGYLSARDVGVKFGVGNAHLVFVGLSFEQGGARRFFNDALRRVELAEEFVDFGNREV